MSKIPPRGPTAPGSHPWTAHVDTFVRDRLPPLEDQPQFLFDLPELRYPDHLNAAEALADEAIGRGWGERAAILTDEGVWTYRRLTQAANRMAGVLRDDLGLRPGGRVLLRAANSAVLATAWLAVLKVGGIVVTTMPMLRAAELAVILEKARVDIAITADALAADLEAAARNRDPAPRIVTFSRFERLAERAPADFETVRTHRDDPALLAFTSGATGEPKACVHFHRDILAMADTFARHLLKPRGDDVFLATPPLAFTYGLGGGLVFPLRFGAAASFLAETGPEAVLRRIEHHRVSVLFAAPTGYRQMLGLPANFDTTSLRLCVSAGEGLDKATSDAWFDRTGVRLIDGIGATEMMHIFISAAGDDIRPGATGKPAPGYQAAILDDEGRELPAGEAGRLAVRGPTGCRYLDDPRQRAYVQDGWNITGDTFRQDEDGYFWFVARADDMIVSSGYNIAAPEVEAALLAHPAVAECA
ncbi:MAG: AMP-binding protein, partial [Pseudomonadota bacterium]